MLPEKYITKLITSFSEICPTCEHYDLSSCFPCPFEAQLETLNQTKKVLRTNIEHNGTIKNLINWIENTDEGQLVFTKRGNNCRVELRFIKTNFDSKVIGKSASTIEAAADKSWDELKGEKDK